MPTKLSVDSKHQLSWNITSSHGLNTQWFHVECCNLSLGLATKAKGLQGCGLRRKPGVTQHTPGSVRRCEGMNPHTPREFHFGSWSPSGLPHFQKAIWGVKTQWLEEFFISLESSWNADVWNGLSLLIWTSETQVMAKKGPGVKLPIWLLTRKSRESTWFT
jgi:hypothetical protein